MYLLVSYVRSKLLFKYNHKVIQCRFPVFKLARTINDIYFCLKIYSVQPLLYLEWG